MHVELWIPITLLAAFAQNLRSALQKHLTGRLSTSGASYVRFLDAVPVAALDLATLLLLDVGELPSPSPAFGLYALVGGVAQIVGTALLVHTFTLRNFAVGTAFSKTETVQAALFGFLLLGDVVSPSVAAGILISLAGVVALSLGADRRLRDLRTAVPGLLSGAGFAVSAVCYRAASRSLEGESFVLQASFTLLCVSVLQTLLMGAWLRMREPGQLTRTLQAAPTAVLVGAAGMVGSAGWFTAMTLQPVAEVRARGQVELLFTLAASWLFFGERPSLRELAGVVAIAAGLLLVLQAP